MVEVDWLVVNIVVGILMVWFVVEGESLDEIVNVLIVEIEGVDVQGVV